MFEQAEYSNRLDSCRKQMQSRGIDVLIESDPANMNYLSGYDGWSFYVPQALIVTLEDAEPIWFGRGIDVGGARLTTQLSEHSIITYPDEYVQRAERHPMTFLGQLIADKGWGSKRIGIEDDCYYLTPRARDALSSVLPNATFVNTEAMVRRIRLIKSAAEIDVMRMAARTTEHIMQTFFDVVEPGVRHCDAAAAVYQAQISGTEEFGGEYSAVGTLMPKGRGMSTPHLTWTDDPFESGEAVFLEVAGVRHRYHCPLARTIQLGKAPDHLADAAKGVKDGIAAALETAKSGNTAEEVEAAWRKVIGRYGLTKESRVGYSIGLGYPPDWGERTISFRPGDKSELQKNMTFHLMTGMWLDDWGVEISESFYVTDSGGIPFTNTTRDLVVKC